MTRTRTHVGIEPLTHLPQGQTQHLTAAAYTLPGRTIVRLVPEALTEAEDRTLDTIGAQPVSHAPVGYTTPRAIGFPAWPILSDPDNAHHALHLVGELEWARRRAGSAKNTVKQRLNQLAATLSASAPHFVPTLLEEAARIFAAADNLTYATQMFNQARETERTRSLAVDDQRHRAMFQEFTALGVVGIKALRAEAQAAPARDGDPHGVLDYLIDLNATRLRAGHEPYRGLVKDLRAAGKIAGLGAAETDDRFFDAVVDIPAVLHAPADFLSGMRDSLVRYARTRPAARALLARIHPREMNTDEYLALLEESGTVAELRADPQAWAEWLLELIAQMPQRPDRQGTLVDQVLDTREQLAGHEVQLPLQYVDLDVLDALLECGVRIAGPESDLWYHSVNWSSWLQATNGVRARALDYVAADPVLGEDARQALRSAEIRSHADILLATSGTRQILDDVLQRHRQLRDGPALSVAGLREFHATAADLAQPPIAEHLPEPLREVLDVDAVELLQHSVRGGVLAELTWPAAEEAIRRLCAQAGTEKYRLFSTYPAVAVVAGRHLEVIDGDQVIASGQLPEDMDWIFGVQHMGETAVCYYRDTGGDYLAYWLHTQAATTVTDPSSTFSAVNYSLPYRDGRLTGKGHLTVGDTTHFGPATTVLTTDPDTATVLADGGHSRTYRWDGESFHQVQYTAEELTRDLGLRELGLDIPELGPDTEIRLEHSTLVPAQPGTADSPPGNDQRRPRPNPPEPRRTREHRHGLRHFRRPRLPRSPAPARGRGLATRLPPPPRPRHRPRPRPHRPQHHPHAHDRTLPRGGPAPDRPARRRRQHPHALLPPHPRRRTTQRPTHRKRQPHKRHRRATRHRRPRTHRRHRHPRPRSARSGHGLRHTAGLDQSPDTDTPEPELTLSDAASQLLNPDTAATPGATPAPTAHPHTVAGIAGLLRHARNPDATPTDDHGLHVTGWNRIIGNETLLIARSLGPRPAASGHPRRAGKSPTWCAR